MALVAALVVCVLYTPVAHAQGAAPTFDSANYDREVAENTPAGQNVGTAVSATGGTGALTYTLTGAGAASFDIVATSGQIRTKTGVTYDHEATSSYTVTVTATDTASMTGSAADGTELIVNGVSHAMGEPQVGYGAPGAGPIHSGLTAANTEERHLYGLSENFLIVAPGLVSYLDQFDDYLDDLLDQFYVDFSHLSFSEYMEKERAIIAQYYAETSDSRTGMRAQRFTTGPHPNGYEQVGFQIGYPLYGARRDYDLALYTVDASGHPDTKVADMTNPVGDSSRQLTFEAPEATVLDRPP